MKRLIAVVALIVLSGCGPSDTEKDLAAIRSAPDCSEALLYQRVAIERSQQGAAGSGVLRDAAELSVQRECTKAERIADGDW